MPFNLSTGELLVLLLVAVCVFGGRLPEVARKVGGVISQFKRGMRDEMRRMETDIASPADWKAPADWGTPADREEPPGRDEPAGNEEPAGNDEAKGNDEPAGRDEAKGNEARSDQDEQNHAAGS